MGHESYYKYGYESWTHTKVLPLQAPIRCRWRVGPVREKTTQPPAGTPGTPASGQEEITMQLTADQQVDLSISGEDAYDNPVDVSGDVVWTSSDESIVTVQGNGTSAVAVAVGPVGTAAVTVSNDVNQDGSGDFQGSLAIDVVAGNIAEIVIQPGQVSAKTTGGGSTDTGEPPYVDNSLPTGGDANTGGDHVDNTLPGDLPSDGTGGSTGDHVDNTLPGDLPTDQPSGGDQPYVDPRRK